jgi:hypothetical protein
MNSNTRSTILASTGVLILIAIGVWWYFGFSLDFMRFFAAEPGATNDQAGGAVSQLCIAPEGCSCSGTSVVLAYGAEGTSYQFFVPGGTMAMTEGQQNRIVVNYTTPGIKQVLVVGQRAGVPGTIDVAACPITVANTQVQ